MGVNGSKSSGKLDQIILRQYKSVYSLGKNIMVIESIDSNKRVKLPEESNSGDRIYVVANKDGTLKSIGLYGTDCLKQIEIHTHDGHGPTPHYHKWSNGRPETKGSGKNAKTVPHQLTPQLKLLFNYIKTFFP